MSFKADTLFQAFVVCGLPATVDSLRDVTGELQGYHGSAKRYLPVVQHTVFSTSERNQLSESDLPAQLAMCCLPDGVQILLTGAGQASETKVYSVVLTGGDGSRLYVSCLSYAEDLPSGIVCQYPGTLGARASKVLCLVSVRPYLTTMEAVLKQLYTSWFVQGSQWSAGDMVNHILSVPCPGLGNWDAAEQVTFDVCGRSMQAPAPCPLLGLPLAEVGIKPLLEALSVDNVTLLFLAVLLERRVVLRSRDYRLMTLAGEAVRQLLYPFKYMHTYIPAMPACLSDYLDAPTPFLMGLQCSVDLPHGVAEDLVVVDLDQDDVEVCEDDDLAQHLTHPAVAKLRQRLKHLVNPSAAAAEEAAQQQVAAAASQPEPGSMPSAPLQGLQRLHSQSLLVTEDVDEEDGQTGAANNPNNPSDTGDYWVAQAQALAGTGWTNPHELLVRRLFLDFMAAVLDGYHNFMPKLARQSSSLLDDTLSRYMGPDSAAGAPPSVVAGPGTVRDVVASLESVARQFSGVLRRQSSNGAGLTSRWSLGNATSAPLAKLTGQDEGTDGVDGLFVMGDAEEGNKTFNTIGFVHDAGKNCTASGALLKALTQTLGFMSFIEEQTQAAELAAPGAEHAAVYEWLHQGVQVLDPTPNIPDNQSTISRASGRSNTSGVSKVVGPGLGADKGSSSVVVWPPCRKYLLQPCKASPFRCLPPLNLIEEGLITPPQTPTPPRPSSTPGGPGAATTMRAHASSASSSALPAYLSSPHTLRERSLRGGSVVVGRMGGLPGSRAHAWRAGSNSGFSDHLGRMNSLGGGGSSEVSSRAGSLRASAGHSVLRGQSPRGPGPMEAAAALAGLRYHRTSTSTDSLAHNPLWSPPPAGPSPSPTVTPQDPVPAPIQPATSFFRLTAPWKRHGKDSQLGPGSQGDAQTSQVPPEQDPTLQASPLSGVQLEADLARRQGRMLKQLLRPADPTSQEASLPGSAERPLLRLHLGSSTWLLAARLQDELQRDPAPPRSDAHSDDSAPDRGPTQDPPIAVLLPPDRLVDAVRFDLLVELLSGAINSAVHFRDWQVLSNLLACALQIVLYNEDTGAAYKERALSALGETQPLIHHAAAWAGIVKSVLVDAFGSGDAEAAPFGATPAGGAWPGEDPSPHTAKAPVSPQAMLLPERALGALQQCALMMVSVGLCEENCWHLLNHVVSTHMQARQKSAGGALSAAAAEEGRLGLAGQLLAVRACLRLAATAREEAMLRDRLRLGRQRAQRWNALPDFFMLPELKSPEVITQKTTEEDNKPTDSEDGPDPAAMSAAIWAAAAQKLQQQDDSQRPALSLPKPAPAPVEMLARPAATPPLEPPAPAPAPGSLHRDLGLSASGRDLGLSASGRDLGLSAPGRDLGLSAPGRDLGLSAPGRDLGLSAPGRDLGLSAPGRDLGLSASGRDLGLSASGRDLGLSASGRDLGLSASGRDLGLSASGRDLGLSASGRDLGLAAAARNLGLPTAPREPLASRRGEPRTPAADLPVYTRIGSKTLPTPDADWEGLIRTGHTDEATAGSSSSAAAMLAQPGSPPAAPPHTPSATPPKVLLTRQPSEHILTDMGRLNSSASAASSTSAAPAAPPAPAPAVPTPATLAAKVRINLPQDTVPDSLPVPPDKPLWQERASVKMRRLSVLALQEASKLPPGEELPTRERECDSGPLPKLSGRVASLVAALRGNEERAEPQMTTPRDERTGRSKTTTPLRERLNVSQPSPGRTSRTRTPLRLSRDAAAELYASTARSSEVWAASLRGGDTSDPKSNDAFNLNLKKESSEPTVHVRIKQQEPRKSPVDAGSPGTSTGSPNPSHTSSPGPSTAPPRTTSNLRGQTLPSSHSAATLKELRDFRDLTSPGPTWDQSRRTNAFAADRNAGDGGWAQSLRSMTRMNKTGPAATTSKSQQRMPVIVGSDGAGGCIGQLDGIIESAPVTALDAAQGVCVLGAADGSDLTTVRWQGGTGSALTNRIPLPKVRGGCSLLSMLPDATLCAVAGRADNGLVLVDIPDGRALSRLAPVHSRRVTRVALRLPGPLMMSASMDDYARLWDLRRAPGSSVGSNAAVGVHARQSGVTSLLLDSAAMQAFTGGEDGSIKLWDLRQVRQPIACLMGHSRTINHLLQIPVTWRGRGATGSQRRILASCSADWTVRLWEPAATAPPAASSLNRPGSSAPSEPASYGGTCQGVLVGHGGPVQTACLLPTSSSQPLLATAAADGSLAVWDVAVAVSSPLVCCLELQQLHRGATTLLSSVSGTGGSGQSMIITGGTDGVGRLTRVHTQPSRPGSQAGSSPTGSDSSSQGSTGSHSSGELLTKGTTVPLGGDSSVMAFDTKTYTLYSASLENSLYMWQPKLGKIRFWDSLYTGGKDYLDNN